MMALCCCTFRKSRVPENSERQTIQEPTVSRETPENIELIKPASGKPESQPTPADTDNFTLRPRSASDEPKPRKKFQKPHQTPSFGNIPEETNGNSLQPPLSSQNVMSKTSSSLSSDGLPTYQTPLNRSPVHMREHHTSQEQYKILAARIERAEQQYTGLTEMISTLIERIDKLETEKQEAAPDVGELTDAPELQVPQNCSVSTDVLFRLAKRVTQWKFLARQLHLNETDIQQIEADYSGDIREQSYQMLLKWSLTCNKASYHTLGEAVREEFGKSVYCDFVKMANATEVDDSG